MTFQMGQPGSEDRLFRLHRPTIGVTDWALTHSDVTYDVVPVWNGAFFRLNAYLGRFEASVAAARMTIGMNRSQIVDALQEMVGRSGLRKAYCAMVAARGTPLIPGSRDPRDCGNHFYAWCVPYIHVVKPGIADQGVRIWLAKYTHRIPPDSVNPLVKNYHWGDFTSGLFEAKDNGYETVVLADPSGDITEGPGFNIFALKGNTVVTPDRGVLHGITRKTALELCADAGFAIEERALPGEELMQADEVFLSTSGGGIIPVAQVGKRVFSNGAAGPVATKLRRQYFKLLESPEYRTEVNY